MTSLAALLAAGLMLSAAPTAALNRAETSFDTISAKLFEMRVPLCTAQPTQHLTAQCLDDVRAAAMKASYIGEELGYLKTTTDSRDAKQATAQSIKSDWDGLQQELIRIQEQYGSAQIAKNGP